MFWEMMLTAPACPFGPLNHKHLNTLIICFMLLYLKNRMRQAVSKVKRLQCCIQPGYGRHPDNLQGYLGHKSHCPHSPHTSAVLSMMRLSYGRLCYLDLLQQHLLPLVLNVIQKTALPLDFYVPQKPLLSLDVSVRQQPVLPASMSVLLQSVMPMNMSFYCSLWCPWTCLPTSSLCCPWTWLVYSGQSCPCRLGLYIL